MKNKFLAASVLTALVLVAAFAFMPRSGATQEKHTPRKGPRALPTLRSEVQGVELANARFENGDDSLVVYDVINNTPTPMRQFIIYVKDPTGDSSDGYISLRPDNDVPAGGSVKHATPTDNIPDGGALTLGAALFDDGTEAGVAPWKGRMKAQRDIERKRGTLTRPDPPARPHR